MAGPEDVNQMEEPVDINQMNVHHEDHLQLGFVQIFQPIVDPIFNSLSLGHPLLQPKPNANTVRT